MNPEITERVLEEVLEELKSINNSMQEQKQQTWQLQEKVEDFAKKLDGKELVAPPVDTKPVQSIIMLAFAKIQQLVAEQPKPVVHERRFLLFPEQYGKEYYNIIFKLIMWMTVVCMGAYLFALGKQALENAKEVKLRELEADHYQNAWEYLYQQQTKQGKMKMETVWEKSRLTSQ